LAGGGHEAFMPAPLRQGIGVVECEGLDRAELPEFNDSDPSDAVSLGVTVGVRSADGPAVRERETYASTASRSAETPATRWPAMCSSVKRPLVIRSMAMRSRDGA
jgi:hypothetical protein